MFARGNYFGQRIQPRRTIGKCAEDISPKTWRQFSLDHNLSIEGCSAALVLLNGFAESMGTPRAVYSGTIMGTLMLPSITESR